LAWRFILALMLIQVQCTVLPIAQHFFC